MDRWFRKFYAKPLHAAQKSKINRAILHSKLSLREKKLISRHSFKARFVLNYGLDEIEDEELVHTSNVTEKCLTKQTKGEPHNLDFTIGNGVIPYYM